MSDIEAAGGEMVRKDRTKTAATRSRGSARSEQEAWPGLFRRLIIYIKQVIAEMKKVTYPGRRETWTYFTVVVVFVVSIMIFTGLVDFGFGRLTALIFG
ncbi:preprotein translocase subunit SecE [Schaalia sp. lx-260]|uniref:preprotein translocase subunit SecE n=1 Tax=Schaalia sp. lx-260 TaxID=2899082 RepID=UPI001E385FC1|nr:preprotein translocase subunit SecE [Schaalia sp. lx-260]MCD4550295.1 preprotein translocase subunit SecE [Schaalia sp. lx-260]